MKKNTIACILVFCIILAINHLWAQPGFDDDVQDTPIDGGIGFLVASGIAYGIAKLKSIKEK